MLADPAANPRFVEYQKKLAAVTKARDDYLAARRDEFAREMHGKLSQYLKAAPESGFRPAQSEARRAGAGRRTEFATAARRDVDLAQACFDASMPRTRFLVRGGHSPACRPISSRPRRPSFSGVFDRSKDEGRGGSPAGRQGRAGEPAPASMGEVIERYTALLAQLETRWKEHSGEVEGHARFAACRSPSGSRCGRPIFEAGGALAVNNDGMRFILDQGQRGRLEKLNGAIQQINATDPASPPRAMVMNDAAQPVNPHVFLRGNPGRPGAAVPRRFLKVLSGSDTPGLSERERPARAGPGDREHKQPADRTRAGEPGVDVAFRQRPGRHAQRLWAAQRPPFSSRAARLSGRRVHRLGLVDQGAASADHALEHVPAAERAAAARAGATPKTGCSGGSTGSGSISSRCATRCWRSRARSGRISAGRRRRSNRRLSPRGARFTASSTARTLTASTGRSTSPCPTRPAPGGL